MNLDEFCSRILALSMQGMLYHCSACMVYDIISPQNLPADFLLPALYVPLFLFTVIRDKCSKFSIFFLLHVLISGISVSFTANTLSRIIVSCCVIIMFIFSFRLRLKPVYDRQETCPPIISVFLFLLIYITAQFNGRIQLVRISYYEIFLYLILFAVYKSLHNTSVFLKSNVGTEKLPVENIRSLNKIILSVFIVILIIGMFGMQRLPIDSFLSGLGGLLLIILKGILRFIFSLFGNGDITADESSSEDILPPPIEATNEISPFLQMLERFLMTVFHLLLIYIFVKILIRFLYELYRRFYEQHESDTDSSEFLLKKTLDNKKIKRTLKKREPLRFRNADEKIRHMYKKYIRRQFDKKYIIPSSLTPSELEQLAADQRASADLSQNTENGLIARRRLALYEKARYSQKECSRQDVEQMKKTLRDK